MATWIKKLTRTHYSSHIGASDNAMFYAERAKEYNYLVTGEVRLETTKTLYLRYWTYFILTGMPPLS